MENGHGYCVKCRAKKVMKNPIRTKLRNHKTRNKTVDTLKGRCPDCDGSIYHVVGHG